MNSVMQVLFTLDDFQKKYFKNYEFYIDQAAKAANNSPAFDFNAQTAKLADGLLSGRYSIESKPNTDTILQAPSGIRPQMFRSLIGRNHPDFSTKQQQDAAEFLQYFMEKVHEHCQKETPTTASFDPSTCFQYEIEERIFYPDLNKVRYLTRDDMMFRLNVPLNESINKNEVEEYNRVKQEMEQQGKRTNELPVVRPIVRLSSSIAQWSAEDIITDYKLNRDGPATTLIKTQRFRTFPDYLIIQLRKYTFNNDWTPKKIDVSMEVSDELDLNHLRGTGLQPDETSMPSGSSIIYFKNSRTLIEMLYLIKISEDDSGNSSASNSAEVSVQVNEVLLQQLVEMGFSVEGCKRALINTGNNNIEAAMNWVFEHSSDPDFDTPYQAPSKKARVDTNSEITVSWFDLRQKDLFVCMITTIDLRLMKKALVWLCLWVFRVHMQFVHLRQIRITLRLL